MTGSATSSPIVILAGARTPMGRFQGGLSSCSATDLGAGAIAAAIERSGITPEDVNFAYLGNVVAAGVGQVPARRAAADAGIPLTVPSTLLNRACLSGLHAIHLASQMIRLGEADTVVAGGMESMTNAPYLLTKARSGYRIGDGTVVDSMMADGLTCTLEHCAMGEATERYAAELGLAREPQDAFAAASHERPPVFGVNEHVECRVRRVDVHGVDALLSSSISPFVGTNREGSVVVFAFAT